MLQKIQILLVVEDITCVQTWQGREGEHVAAPVADVRNRQLPSVNALAN